MKIPMMAGSAMKITDFDAGCCAICEQDRDEDGRFSK